MGVESILNKDHWIPLSISWSYLTSVFDIRKRRHQKQCRALYCNLFKGTAVVIHCLIFQYAYMYCATGSRTTLTLLYK